jgi:hypothetical protein
MTAEETVAHMRAKVVVMLGAMVAAEVGPMWGTEQNLREKMEEMHLGEWVPEGADMQIMRQRGMVYLYPQTMDLVVSAPMVVTVVMLGLMSTVILVATTP